MIWISFENTDNSRKSQAVIIPYIQQIVVCVVEILQSARMTHTFSSYLIQNRLTFFAIVVVVVTHIEWLFAGAPKKSNFQITISFYFSLTKPNQFRICICICISIWVVKFNPNIQQNGDSFFLYSFAFFADIRKNVQCWRNHQRDRERKEKRLRGRESEWVSKTETKMNGKNSSFISVIHFMTMF